MSYEKYTIDDFLADEYFQQWVLHPAQESEAFWEAWLQRYPEKETLVTQARQMLLVVAAKEKDSITQEQSEQLWQGIHHAIHRDAPDTFHRKKHPKQSWLTFVPAWQRVAASVTGVALLGLLYFFYFYWKTHRTDDYTTAYRETKSIELPDGSKVVLNANSTLQVAARWDNDIPREVWLRGEAFFEVQKLDVPLEGAKFIVHTDNLEVEVLGTKFNVNDRQDKAQVVLNTGIVKLKMDQHEGETEVTMKPGEMIEFSGKEKSIRKKTVDPEVFSAWKDNKLIFHETPVSEVLQRLKNTYGLEVTLKDTNLANREYTGTFPDPDPEIIIKTLAVMFDLQITRKGNQIILE
jgi:ferric-dicitrate binding protein FerR (iron transport regulator)